MFDHVTLRASDVEASERFYRTVLPLVGAGAPDRDDDGFPDWGELSLYPAETPDAVTRRLHLGLVAPSREVVDAFWQTGVDAGYASDGEPGPRPQYVDDYYGAFLLDPDGNSVEAMLYTGARQNGWIDHLWIRVADVAASRAFYELAAPFGGFHLEGGREGRATFSPGDGRGSFSLTPATDDWPATENLHIAFPGTRELVDGFWEALVREGGYRDHGAPGERPQYHPGYYGAFVLDPDGNNVEVVHHAR
ncbi:MAG TPA: VOC family protein [Capillimicrobium sp.]